MAADRFLKFPILNRTSQPATRPPNFRTPARACKDPPEYTRREEERGSGRKGVQPAKPASQPTSLPCIGGRAVRPLVYSGRAGVVNHCIAAAAPVGVVAGLRWPLCEGRVPAVSTAVSQRPRLRALSLDLQRSHRCSAHPSLRGGPVHPPAHRRGRRGWWRPQAPLLSRLPVGPPGAPRRRLTLPLPAERRRQQPPWFCTQGGPRVFGIQRGAQAALGGSVGQAARPAPAACVTAPRTAGRPLFFSGRSAVRGQPSTLRGLGGKSGIRARLLDRLTWGSLVTVFLTAHPPPGRPWAPR